ncbi:MAG TPA: tRNA uridine-5-carboxymethylaminomethyl(34) synthesis GTPase MnmE [Paracoccaceae bacterium]|nr:tRNA uridine-5-carboxymethylaminomethyl(34) synthesis GTPase MnmE [Paracoccaceae bacterium]HMO71272.1 tRNA uridine-5-carboxymethylaminomethyl(34) synthesis GTPase MnmE [Paracoccaceae bacterium]
MDTIFALATARGRSGVAVVRVSGPGAARAAAVLAPPVVEPRRACLRRIVADGVVLDEAVVLRFAAGASFTGEDVVEFQTHGSPAVAAALLRTLAGMPGMRPAEPGEFTRRALENGRMDLSQVEGLSDLLEAETEMQRRQAMRLYTGELAAVVARWRAWLLEAEALVAAAIDFADEDLPLDADGPLRRIVAGLDGELRRELASMGRAERIRDGFEVAILGRPNVGKSTLLNALARREVAITSEVAGTTRDVIEVRLDLGGIPVTMLDMAGLRGTEDPVERIGVARALTRAEAADLRVVLVDDAGWPEGLPMRSDDIVLRAKADVIDGTGRAGVSGRTGAGVPALLAEIEQRLARLVGGAGLMGRARHRHALEGAVGSLESARDALDLWSERPEIAGEHLRGVRRSLESLVGRYDADQVLGEVFARFCIGK